MAIRIEYSMCVQYLLWVLQDGTHHSVCSHMACCFSSFVSLSRITDRADKRQVQVDYLCERAEKQTERQDLISEQCPRAAL